MAYCKKEIPLDRRTGTNGALNFMDIMTAKTARDFALDMRPQSP